MEAYADIRRMVLVEGLSQREVARRLGHSRKTVRKALEHVTPPGYRRSKPVKRPVVDEFVSIIDAWLEADQKKRPKQRHTGERIFQRLRDEHGFTGSASAVRRYIAQRRQRHGEVYFPLAFDPGEEAQVDWGDGYVIENGRERLYRFFCMRLCHSGACFVHAYERMTREAFLDGHIRAFAFFGGVPRRLAYDNLKAAVITVGKGQRRRLAKSFTAFRSHYLFETRFCNRGAGNEKGHVENLVKHTQRTFLTPMPQVTGLDALVAHLQDACRRDLQRPASRDPRPRSELLAEDQERLLPLPAREFEACVSHSTFASKQALVRFDANDYSVPVRCAYRMCVIKGFVDRIEIFCNHELVATHARSNGKKQFVLDWRHYVPLLERKPGGIHGARAFKGAPWGRDLEAMRKGLQFRYGPEGMKEFVSILLLFTSHPEESVRAAVAMCVRRRAYGEAAVRSQMAYTPPQRVRPLDLADRPELAAIAATTRPAAAYDALWGKEVRR